MPIYVFKCEACGYSRDIWLKSYRDVEPTLTCEKCNGLMYRDYGAEKPNFELRGGCWAKQGYEMSDRHCLEENDKMMKEDDQTAKKEAKLGNKDS